MATKSGEKLFYEELTYQIRGACFNVWKQFGGSFKESIIDKALSVELGRRNLKVGNQKRIVIYYKDQKVGTYVPDKIVNNKVLIELKSKPYISKEDEKQFWKYLKGSAYKVGMLINFGPEKLEIKRRIYDRAREKEFFRVDPRNNPRCSASTEKGITLVEIIIAIFLVAIFSLILIADFPEIQKQYALSGATYKLAQDFRKVQDLGLSAVQLKDKNGDPIAVKGYGIYINLDQPTQYIIYADVDGSRNFNKDSPEMCDRYDPSGYSGDCIIEIIDISERNSNLLIEEINNLVVGINYTSVNFSPPSPAIDIQNLAFGYNGIEVVLGIRSESAARTVLVNKAGLISVQ